MLVSRLNIYISKFDSRKFKTLNASTRFFRFLDRKSLHFISLQFLFGITVLGKKIKKEWI